jgi:membrane protein
LILFQSVKDFFNDSAPQWAAAIAYYSLLSSFPLILAIASIISYLVNVDPQWVVDQLGRWLGDFLPQGAAQFESVVESALQARGTVTLLSIGTLLWTGSRVFGAVTAALNIAFDVDETYGFIKRTLIEISMLATIGLLFVLALASSTLLNLLLNILQLLPAGGSLAYQLIIDVVPGLMLVLAFFLIYLLLPRRKVDWMVALAGALVATALFLIARPLFTTYVQNFGNYNIVYGSIGLVVIIIFWAWIVAAILLFGGEIASHLQDIVLEEKSPQDVERNHKQRSPTRSHNDERR